MTRAHSSRLPLAAWAAVALLFPRQAEASLYDLHWAYKWGQGDIVFDTSVPDSNPDPLQGEYFGAIVRYDVRGYILFNEKRVTGSSGSISVLDRDSPDKDNHDPCNAQDCSGAALSFHFGDAALPYDPAGWHLAMTVSYALSDFGDHLPTDEWHPGFGNVNAALDPNTPNGDSYHTIDGGTFVSVVALPVPEPATPALLGVGLGLLAITRLRATPCSSRKPA